LRAQRSIHHGARIFAADLSPSKSQHEVRSETEYFADIPNMTLPREMVQLGDHIVEIKMEGFYPAYLEERYRTVLVEKIREKRTKMPTKSAPSVPEPYKSHGCLETQPRGRTGRRSIGKTTGRRIAADRKTASSESSPRQARRGG
jgi:non-homologous end joining protein Ku